MTLTVEEIVGIVIVAVALGAVIAAIWDVGMAERAASLHYSRGCTATRASLRDALTTLPRLHCSRSAAGHVRLADVERLLAGTEASVSGGCESRVDVLHWKA